MLIDRDSFKFVNLKIFGIRSRKFLYKVRKNLLGFQNFEKIIPGTLFKVPVKNTTRIGLVEPDSFWAEKAPNFDVKEISDIVQSPLDSAFYSFLCQVSKIYMADIGELYSTFVDLLGKCQTKPKPKAKTADFKTPENLNLFSSQSQSQNFVLTSEQQLAVDGIYKNFKKGDFAPCLLHGVTGSGKTEVYKHLILKAAEQGKSSILLLPEISLCERFYHIFKQLDGHGIKVIRYHSALAASENREVLEALNSDKPILLLGVHLPIFLPVSNLGLILVDEEHEQSFCKKSSPRVDSKQMAILRAKAYKVPVVLGSATPSVSSLHSAKTKNWPIFKLTRKITDSSRSVTIQSLTEKEKRINFWVTRRLEQEIELRLEKREQSIIFINRRGHAFSAQCKSCGQALECKNCSVSMTVHKNSKTSWAVCHYCSARRQNLDICQGCGQEDTLVFKGVGTQKICAVLEKRFPDARIMRMDLDSAKSKKEWPEVSKAVLEGKVDILVGTQSIAKGHHFPNVTLVGVVWADLDFNFPSYDAQEAALQKLLQVAGRTGRGDKSGLVVLQTMQSSKLIENLDESHYSQFCEKELSMRQAAKFPPFKKFYQIQLRHKKSERLDADAHSFVRKVIKTVRELEAKGINFVGPFKPPIHKVSGVEIREVIIKGDSLAQIIKVIGSTDLASIKSSLSFRPLF